MKRLAKCLCGLLTLTSLRASAVGNSLELKSGSEICTIFKEMLATLKGPEVERKIRVKIGKNEGLRGVLGLTSKGNGSLRIANLFLRIFDIHDDGIVYKDSCLRVQLKDLNHGGDFDLEISGVALNTEEKSDQSWSEKKIELRYKYVPNERRFLKITKQDFDFIEL